MDDFKVLIQATIDAQKSQKDINKQLKDIQKNAKIQLDLELDKSTLKNRIDTYVGNNPKLKDMSKSFMDLKKNIDNVDKASLDSIKKQFRNLQTEASALGKTGEDAFSKLKKNSVQFMNFLASGTLIMSGVNAIKGLVTEVYNLDKSLVDLQMATGDTHEQAKELLNTYIDLGKELGATGTEVADSASEWLRQGKSISETNELIKDSMILSKIGQIDSAQATELLTSAMKGYKVSVSDVIKIVDKLSAVDMSSATDVEGLATAMSRVASMADLSGVSMDKLLGYLAVVGETTKKDMASVGESFQTIFSRMGNIKIGKMIDDEGESLNDVEKVLNTLGINLRDSKDSFRDFGDVLDDIGAKWGSLSETEQNALGVAVAGTRQRENFVVLMSNYSKALDYAGVSADSTGTAMEKFSSYEDSLEAKTKRLTASFQELATDTLNSGVVKVFLDLANGLINVTDKVGLFNIALIALSGIIGAKTLNIFPQLAEKIALTAVEFGIGQDAALAFGGALSTMIPAALIIGGITAIVKAYAYFNVTLEEHKQLLEKAKQSYEESSTELETINQKLDETKTRMAELNAMDNLTFVEKDELDNLKQTTEQLLIQKDVLEKLNAEKQKSVLDETASTYNSQFGKTSITQSQISDAISNANTTGNNAILMSDKNDIVSMIAAYKQFNVLKDKAYGNNDEVQRYGELLGDISTSLFKNIDDLNNYKTTLESIPYDKLSDEQKKALDNVNSSIELIYKNLDPNKWKDIQFQKIISGEDVKDVVASLNELSKTKPITPSQIESSRELMASLKNAGISASDAAEQFNALNDSSENASNSLSSSSDQAQDTSKSIYTLADSVEAATGYINDLGSNVDISKLQDGIENARSSIEDFNSILQDMKDNGGITGDSLEKIINKYPALLQYIGDESKLRDEVQKAIKEQTGLAEDYYKQVLDMDTNLYNEVVKNNADRINKLSDDYKTDISNWKSLAQAKADIDGKLLTELTQKWADYYSTRSKLLSAENEINNSDSPILKQSNDLNLFGVGNLGNPNTDFLNKQKQALKDLSNEAKNAQNNYDGLKNIFSDVDYSGKIAGTISGVKETPSKNSSKSEYSQQLDWIANSASIAAEKVDKLKDALDDDAPLKTQISNLKKLIDGQKSLANTYTKAAKAYKSEYQDSISGLSAKYIKQIESGGSFNIQDFSGESGEKLYNQITTAQKLWGLYSSSLNDASKTTKELTENTKKLSELGIDKILEPFVTKYEKQQSTLDDISQALNFVDDGSKEQLQLYESGYYAASKSVENLKKEITALNKAYKDKTDDNYINKLSDLQDKLNDSASAMKNYKDEIVNSMKQDYNEQTSVLEKALSDQLDAIEKAHDAIIDSLNDQLDAYKEIIDAKKESLKATEDEYQYQKSISEKTNNISKINSRIAELSKAANSGDRQAAAELKKLQDDLADAQTDLDDAQHDHKVDLEENALDKAYSDYEKLINGEIDLENKNYEAAKANAQSIYDFKKSQLDILYATESDYIKQAANLTSLSFSSVFESINKTLSEYGLSMSSGLSSVLKNTNSSLTSPSVGIAIGAANGITNLLSRAKFADGGVIGDINSSVKGLGEDGLAVLSRKESVLTEPETRAYQMTGGYLADMVRAFKSFNLNPANYTTNNNNNNSPVIQIDNLLTVQGNMDKGVVNGLDSSMNYLVEQVTDNLMKKMRKF